jgi:hypothetical protein
MVKVETFQRPIIDEERRDTIGEATFAPMDGATYRSRFRLESAVAQAHHANLNSIPPAYKWPDLLSWAEKVGIVQEIDSGRTRQYAVLLPIEVEPE